MNSHRAIEAVIFDLDDTLIDWSGQSMSWQEFSAPRTENVRRFLLKSGYTMPPEDAFNRTLDGAIRSLWEQAKETLLIQSLGELIIDILGEMGHNIDSLDMRTLLKVYDWGPFPGVRLFSDTIPVLNRLQREGYKIGLVTNSFLPMWMRDVELEAYHILRFMDARLTAADVGYIKPHPQIFECVLDLLEIKPENALFVGDRPKHDIAGANKAGLVSVLYRPPHVDFEMNGVIPDFTITSLSQLIPILESLNPRHLFNS